jgi:hypothetical protein
MGRVQPSDPTFPSAPRTRAGRVLTAVPSPTGDGTDGVPGQGTPRHRTWELAPIPLPCRPRRLPASYQRVPGLAGACRGA